MHHSVEPRSRKLFACRAIRPGNSERKLACSRGGEEDINSLLLKACSRVSLTGHPTENAQWYHCASLAVARCRQVHGGPKGPLPQNPPRLAGAGDVQAGCRQSSKRIHGSKKASNPGPLAKAEGCAHRHDQRGLYRVVRQLAPWKLRTKVLLKGEGGALLNHEQEHATLVEHSRNLFAPRQLPPDRTGVQLPLVFTVEEVEAQLRLTKVGRAVPPGIAPPRPGNWQPLMWLHSCKRPSKLELSRTRPSRASGLMPGLCGCPSRAKHRCRAHREERRRAQAGCRYGAPAALHWARSIGPNRSREDGAGSESPTSESSEASAYLRQEQMLSFRSKS